MCLNEIDLYCLQAYRPRSCAGFALDSIQQLQGAGLICVQLRVQLEFALLRALLALDPAVVAHHPRRPSSSVRKVSTAVPSAVLRVAFCHWALADSSAAATGSPVHTRLRQLVVGEQQWPPRLVPVPPHVVGQ